MQKKTDCNNDSAKEREFGTDDDREDDEHNGVIFLSIPPIFQRLDEFVPGMEIIDSA